jgi:hypothetical protein
MAKHDGRHVGRGAHGKNAGVGAKTEAQPDAVGENMILSNRDKSQHSDERGQDSKWIQTEQLRDHAANRNRDRR